MTQAAESYLPDLVPIRRILVDSIMQQFVRDLNLDGQAFSVSVDASTGVITLTTTGKTHLDTASFGVNDDVVSKFFRHFTTVAAIDSIGSYTMALGEAAYDFVVTVNGKKRSSGDTYSQDHRVRYTRTASGAPTIKGSLISGTVVRTGVFATAISTLDVSGNDLLIEITPNTADDVDWTATLQIQITREIA